MPSIYVHLLFGFVIAFAFRLIFIGNSLIEETQLNNFAPSPQTKSQFLVARKIERRKRISDYFKQLSNQEETLMIPEDEKIGNSSTITTNPAWIHDHHLILSGKDFFVNHHNDDETTFEKSLLEFLDQFLLDHHASQEKLTNKNNQKLISSIIFKGSAWQDPLHWGRPNPDIFLPNNNNNKNRDSTSSSYYNRMSTLEKFSALVQNLKTNYGVRVMLELSAFLPQTTSQNSILKQHQVAASRNHAPHLLTKQDSYFIGTFGKRNSPKSSQSVAAASIKPTFEILEVTREIEQKENVVVSGNLLNFDSETVKEWATSELLPLIEEAGVDGFIVDCADDELFDSSRKHYVSVREVLEPQNDDDLKNNNKITMKLEPVSQESYNKKCHRWFHDTFRLKFGGAAFVTGAVMMRPHRETGTYTSDNIFGGSSSCAVGSATFGLIAGSGLSTDKKRNQNFANLREGFMAAAHGFYTGIDSLGIILPSNFHDDEIDEDNAFDPEQQQKHLKALEQDSKIKDDNPFELLLSQKKDHGKECKTKEHEVKIVKKASAALRFLHFSATLPIFVSSSSLILELAEFDLSQSPTLQTEYYDSTKQKGTLEKLVVVLKMLNKQQNTKNEKPLLLVDYFRRSILMDTRFRIFSPLHFREASQKTFLSRIQIADNILQVPFDHAQIDTNGIDLFEQHMPATISMWPANPHRIQIFHPLFWQFFVGGSDEDEKMIKNAGASDRSRHEPLLLVSPLMYDVFPTKKLVFLTPQPSSTSWYLESYPGIYFSSSQSSLVVEFSLNSFKDVDSSLLIFRRRGTILQKRMDGISTESSLSSPSLFGGIYFSFDDPENKETKGETMKAKFIPSSRDPNLWVEVFHEKPREDESFLLSGIGINAQFFSHEFSSQAMKTAIHVRAVRKDQHKKQNRKNTEPRCYFLNNNREEICERIKMQNDDENIKKENSPKWVESVFESSGRSTVMISSGCKFAFRKYKLSRIPYEHNATEFLLGGNNDERYEFYVEKSSPYQIHGEFRCT